MMVMKKYGADVLRWYFYTINDPGDSKRFTEDDLAKITRKFVLIIYNSFVFWNSYGKHESARKGEPQIKHVLDRWILASLNTLTKEVTAKLDAYQIGEAGRLIEAFADDLSRWYIRRSRDRFQSGSTSEEQDHEAASHTLRLALETISRLLAPFMPFFADALYQSVGGVQKSVHLADWPTISEESDEDDKALPQKMAKVRALAAEALALRAELKLKVRQPLASATIKKGTFEEYADDELMAILKDEINVKKILFADQLPEGKAIILDTEITAELKEEGMVRELVRTIQGLRQDAGYQVGDEIVLMIEASDKLFDVVQRNSIQLKKAVGASQLEMKKSEKFDIQLESKLDEAPIWIGLRKI
jgi:isoleucyl-tRNA synthetase